MNIGTYLKLAYDESGDYVVNTDGSTDWTDYTATLTIYVNNESVKTQLFDVTEGNSGTKEIDYTIN